MPIMIRLSLSSIILAFILTLAGGAAYAQTAAKRQIIPLDRIVAIVNEEPITLYELNDRTRTVMQQLQRQGTPLPQRAVIEKQVLERMIMDRAQLQLAKETGVRVDDTQLAAALQKIAEENKLSVAEFRQAVEKEGINFNKFREDIRNEIILVRLRERDIDNRLLISENEIDQFLKTAATQKGADVDYNLAQILVRVPEQATPEQLQEKRKRAESALAELKNGADFGQVAASYSDAPDALKGGVVGWRPGGQIPALFLDALAKLQPEQISGVLRSPNGFHIIKLLAKRGKDAPLIVQQSRVRHILIKSNELVSESDAKYRLLQLKERLDNGSDFAQIARLHSEDPSASRGGELGWLSPGDTVPPFEAAVAALKINQISEPVQTPFGWHLIQVLERRAEDVSGERQRLSARNEIRARKAEEAYQEWLRQLRDRAYVEYRLEEKF